MRAAALALLAVLAVGAGAAVAGQAWGAALPGATLGLTQPATSTLPAAQAAAPLLSKSELLSAEKPIAAPVVTMPVLTMPVVTVPAVTPPPAPKVTPVEHTAAPALPTRVSSGSKDATTAVRNAASGTAAAASTAPAAHPAASVSGSKPSTSGARTASPASAKAPGASGPSGGDAGRSSPAASSAKSSSAHESALSRDAAISSSAGADGAHRALSAQFAQGAAKPPPGTALPAGTAAKQNVLGAPQDTLSAFRTPGGSSGRASALTSSSPSSSTLLGLHIPPEIKPSGLLATLVVLVGMLLIAFMFADEAGIGPRHAEWRARWAYRISRR